MSKALSMETCLGEEVNVDQSALGFKFSPKVLRGMLVDEAYLARFP